MNTKYNPSKIVNILILWCIYTALYGAISNYGEFKSLAGYMSLFAEVGLDFTCLTLAFFITRKAKLIEKTIFRLVAISFVFAIFSDASYNLILNILGIRNFSLKLESSFDLPFTAFLLLQSIAWSLVFKIIYNESKQHLKILIALPFFLSGAVILLTFLFLPTWQVNPLSVEGIYNISDTLLEVISFGFVVICLFSARDKNITLLASGYLIIIASDFIIRFAEVEKVLFPGSALETTWILGLMLFASGLYKINISNNINIRRSLNKWNSLNVQIGYWIFTSSLCSIFILLLLNYIFSNLDLKGIRDIPATLVVFAVLSSILSHGIASYLIRPFKHLNHIVSTYSQGDLKTPENIKSSPQIEEFIQLEDCLYEGISAIKNRTLIEKSYFESVVNYTNQIRNPVSAIHMLVTDIDELPDEKKSLLIDAANLILSNTDTLIQKMNGLPNKCNKALLNSQQQNHSNLQVIMIDDNKNLAMAWEMDAANFSVPLTTYNDPENFMRDAGGINKEVVLYIDINLSEDMSGIELSKWAYKQGFSNIYLITGENANNFQEMHWIKGVFGKEPPFSSFDLNKHQEDYKK